MKKLSFILSLIIFGQLAFGQAVHDRSVIPVAVNLNQVLRMTVTNGGNIEFVFNSIDDYRLGLSAYGAALGLDNPEDPDIIAAATVSNDGAFGGGANTGTGTGEGGLVEDVDGVNFYKTSFTVASSTRWKIIWGAENATFIGTDDPGNTLALDNVGFSLSNQGAHELDDQDIAGADIADGIANPGDDEELLSVTTENGNTVCALEQYPAAENLLEDNDDADQANAGDATDNSFELLWRCGTTEQGFDNGGLVDPGRHPMNPLSLMNQGDINPDRYVVNVVFELATDF